MRTDHFALSDFVFKFFRVDEKKLDDFSVFARVSAKISSKITLKFESNYCRKNHLTASKKNSKNLWISVCNGVSSMLI